MEEISEILHSKGEKCLTPIVISDNWTLKTSGKCLVKAKYTNEQELNEESESPFLGNQDSCISCHQIRTEQLSNQNYKREITKIKENEGS